MDDDYFNVDDDDDDDDVCGMKVDDEYANDEL